MHPHNFVPNNVQWVGWHQRTLRYECRFGSGTSQLFSLNLTLWPCLNYEWPAHSDARPLPRGRAPTNKGKKNPKRTNYIQSTTTLTHSLLSKDALESARLSMLNYSELAPLWHDPDSPCRILLDTRIMPGMTHCKEGIAFQCWTNTLVRFVLPYLI